MSQTERRATNRIGACCSSSCSIVPASSRKSTRRLASTALTVSRCTGAERTNQRVCGRRPTKRLERVLETIPLPKCRLRPQHRRLNRVALAGYENRHSNNFYIESRSNFAPYISNVRGPRRRPNNPGSVLESLRRGIPKLQKPSGKQWKSRSL